MTYTYAITQTVGIEVKDLKATLAHIAQRDVCKSGERTPIDELQRVLREVVDMIADENLTADMVQVLAADNIYARFVFAPATVTAETITSAEGKLMRQADGRLYEADTSAVLGCDECCAKSIDDLCMSLCGINGCLYNGCWKEVEL